MQRHDIAFLVNYNYWATARVLAAASRLAPAAFVAPTTLTPLPLRGTLVHQLDVEWSWRLRWQGRDATDALSEDGVPTVEQLAMRWQADEQALRAFVAPLSDADLERPWAVGSGQARPLWQSIVHVVNHGTQSGLTPRCC